MTDEEIGARTARILATAGDQLAPRRRSRVEYTIRCPFPDRHKNGDRNPSASFNVDKGVWRCYACNEGGGIASLEKALGIESPPSGGSRRRNGGDRPAPERSERAPRVDYERLWQEARDLSNDADRYLIDRGLKDSVLANRAKAPPPGLFPAGYDICVPLYDARGTMVALQARRLGPRRPDGPDDRFRTHGPAARGVFGRLPRPDADEVVVVEGMTDWLAARSLHPAALGLAGATNSAGLASILRPDMRVLVVADADEAGERCYHAVAKMARDARATAARVPLPGPDDALSPRPKDLCDVFAAPHGVARISEALREASRALDPTGFLVPLAEYCAHEPPLVWLVRDLLPLGGLVSIDADPGKGKSWLVMDAMLAVASGQPFLNMPIDTVGTVLYLTEEGLPGRRLKALAAGRDLALARLPVYLSVRRGVKIDDGGWIRRLAAAIEKYRPILVVMDPLREFHLADENKSDEIMESVVGPIRKLVREASRKPTVVLLHHLSAGADPWKGRGSTALRGALDARVALGGDGDLAKGDVVRVDTFCKDDRGVAPFGFRLRVEGENGTSRAWLVRDEAPAPSAQRGGRRDQQDGKDAAWIDARRREIEQAVERAVVAGANDATAIAKAVNEQGIACQRRSVLRAIGALKDAGKIRSQFGSGKLVPAGPEPQATAPAPANEKPETGDLGL